MSKSEMIKKFGSVEEIEKELVIKKNNVSEVQNYIIKECTDPKEAFACSKKYLSSQSYGGVLESFYKRFFNLSKILETQDGDLYASKIGNLEAKASIEFPSKKDITYCMMQLRPAHNVDYYLGVFYSYSESKITYTLIPSGEMKKIIFKYCKSYSHGTKNGKGIVTEEIINNNTEAEFQFTFSTTPSNKKNYKTWLDLKPFVYSEQELINKLK